MAEMETVTAVYEKGVLRPTRRLNLRERQRVQIQILPQEPVETPDEDTEAVQEMERVLSSLVEAGILKPPVGRSDAEPMTEQERRKLAEEIGRMPGKPLSEIIIEDRGEW
jgi:predicted DNA-binding antitoxin AbrB/MazE fold protein